MLPRRAVPETSPVERPPPPTPDAGRCTTFSGVIEVGPHEAQEIARSGGLILDVREPDEWSAGHLEGSLFIPMGDVGARLDEIPADRRVVVVCRSGGRSAAVTEALVGAGVDAVNLAGGVTAWVAGGHPIVDDDGLPGVVI